MLDARPALVAALLFVGACQSKAEEQRPAPGRSPLPPEAKELAAALGAKGEWQRPKVDAVPGPDTALVTLEDNSPAIGGDGRLVQNVGIDEMHQMFTPTLAVGCAVPCWSGEVLSTGRDNASTIDVDVFRGTSSRDSQKLGTIEISGVAPAPRGIPEIELAIGAVENRLVVYARMKRTRTPLAVSRTSN